MRCDLDTAFAMIAGENDPGTRDVAVWAGKASKPSHRFQAYLFHNGRMWLAKMTAGDDAQLANEYAALTHIKQRFRETNLEHSVPRDVRFQPRVLVQEWCRGIHAVEIIVRQRRLPWGAQGLTAVCDRIIDWLANFHRMTRTAPEPTMTSAVQAYGGMHGDFKPSNVLLADGTLTVVDWELWVAEGPQLFDLFHFLTYFALTCAGSNGLDGFVEAFERRSWIAALIRHLILRYRAAIGALPLAVAPAYIEYLDLNLRRRADLGMTNDGYFLQEIRNYMHYARHIPYALAE